MSTSAEAFGPVLYIRIRSDVLIQPLASLLHNIERFLHKWQAGPILSLADARSEVPSLPCDPTSPNFSSDLPPRLPFHHEILLTLFVTAQILNHQATEKDWPETLSLLVTTSG